MLKFSELAAKYAHLKKHKYLLLALAIGVCLIIYSNVAFNRETDEKYGQETAENEELQSEENIAVNIIETEEKAAACELENILTQIYGAGKVSVKIKLSSSSTSQYVFDSSETGKTTQEQDQSGGTRTITEQSSDRQLVLSQRNGQSQEIPVLEKEKAAQVLGVIVVAEGADDPEIKVNLTYAIQAYCSVPLSQIVVLPMKAGE